MTMTRGDSDNIMMGPLYCRQGIILKFLVHFGFAVVARMFLFESHHRVQRAEGCLSPSNTLFD